MLADVTDCRTLNVVTAPFGDQYHGPDAKQNKLVRSRNRISQR